ncbi:MAG: xanthine dehydrogenase family protein molybdopterin-binding subunit [Parvibaculaceae bacterium]
MQPDRRGQLYQRREDLRLIRGLGRYTNDLRFLNEAYLFVLRSPHAAADIASITVDEAAELPGVLAVLTGQQALLEGFGTIPSRVLRYLPDGRPCISPPYRMLAVDRVRHVGEAVVAVVADSLELAKSAANLVQIQYRPLEPSIGKRRSENQRPVWDEAPDNVCFVYQAGDRAAVDAAFQHAKHTVKLDLEISRVSACPMEPRNAIGLYDPGSQRYTLYTGTQEPHTLRSELAQEVLRIPESQLRVVSPDCGGSFGLKMGIFPELPLVLWAAREVGRPVKWQCERSEAFMADHHARDNNTTAELALDEAGRFLALRVDTVADLGAYVSSYGLHSCTNNVGGLAGPYMTPAIYTRVTGVFSNTSPISPYRGAGRPEASYVIERLIDFAATEISIDRIELRRRNMIPPDAMPYKTGLLFVYDSGEFETCMNIALRLSDWSNFEKRRGDPVTDGKLRGRGLASVVELAGGPFTQPAEEFAEIRFNRQGQAVVLLGTHSQGQGHETTFAQVAADFLGVSCDDISVVFGDTDQVPHGQGSFGSRTASVVSQALDRAADKVIEKGRILAAHLLEAAAIDVEFVKGAFWVKGSDRKIDLGSVAKSAFQLGKLPPGFEPGLSGSATVVPSAPTYPNACHVCEVEVDTETGKVSVTAYWVVEDVGRPLNPMLVAGQVHGGVIQGLGQALCEQIAIDAVSGQILTGSFLDYCMPRADDAPLIAIESHNVPCATNSLGIKGVGEAGTVGALPAIMNAVCDALAPLGVKHLDMPATSERVWNAIRNSRPGT